MIELGDRVMRVFELLRQVQPDPDEYDVVWHGPYYIPRPRQWCRTRFTLYEGRLYAGVNASGSWYGLTWTLATGEVAWDRGRSTHLPAQTWAEVLEQVAHRLGSAVQNFDAYNRRVQRLLPLAYRTGFITRRLSWPPDAEPPLSEAEIAAIAAALDRAGRVPHLPEMSVARYLRAAAVAYDAVFEDLRGLAPLEKYRRRADGRHDGLLDLPPDDAAAFATWFADPTFRGGHPWEIVFGHPHGVMLYLRQHTTDWSFSLAVGSEGWYVTGARMARALAVAGLPLEFAFWQQVADALLGVDEITVGPGWPALSYELLAETNPAAVDAVRWDPVPQLGPVTADQLTRIAAASMSHDQEPA